MSGKFFLPVSAEVRENAGVAAGDEFDLNLKLDTDPRKVTVPPDLAAALNGDTAAKQVLDDLSYSNKRRNEKSVGTLRDGRV